MLAPDEYAALAELIQRFVRPSPAEALALRAILAKLAPPSNQSSKEPTAHEQEPTHA